VLPEWSIRAAFSIAEARGRFRVDDVNPVDAAAHILVPVLVIHGAADRDTLPDHSRRVFAALPGRKRLLLIEDARHSQSLRADVWPTIDAWLEEALPSPDHI